MLAKPVQITWAIAIQARKVYYVQWSDRCDRKRLGRLRIWRRKGEMLCCFYNHLEQLYILRERDQVPAVQETV